MAIPKSIKAIDDLFYSSRNCKIEKINGIEKQPKSYKTPWQLLYLQAGGLSKFRPSFIVMTQSSEKLYT